MGGGVARSTGDRARRTSDRDYSPAGELRKRLFRRGEAEQVVYGSEPVALRRVRARDGRAHYIIGPEASRISEWDKKPSARQSSTEKYRKARLCLRPTTYCFAG